MLPNLFHIGPIPIHTYGLMIALGFLSGVQLIKFLARKSQMDPEFIADLAVKVLFIGIIGSRIAYILTRLDYFSQNPFDAFKVWEGGLVFYGGPIAAVPYLIFSLRKKKLPVLSILDIMGPGLVLAHAFGRLGCFGAGCCYGKPTDLPWSVKLYSDLVADDMRGIPLHPTQLYESFSLFILCAGLIWIFFKRKFQGQVALSYFMLYPVIRSILEEFRGDQIRGFVFDGLLSTSQAISMVIFAITFIFWVYFLQKSSKK